MWQGEWSQCYMMFFLGGSFLSKLLLPVTSYFYFVILFIIMFLLKTFKALNVLMCR